MSYSSTHSYSYSHSQENIHKRFTADVYYPKYHNILSPPPAGYPECSDCFNPLYPPSPRCQEGQSNKLSTLRLRFANIFAFLRPNFVNKFGFYGKIMLNTQRFRLIAHDLDAFCCPTWLSRLVLWPFSIEHRIPLTQKTILIPFCWKLPNTNMNPNNHVTHFIYRDMFFFIGP